MLFFRGVKFTDQEVVEGLQHNRQLEDAILKYLYLFNFPKVKKFVLSKGGNEAEAKDIFQDAIIVFYQNVKANKFKHKAKISTYLLILTRNMWINRKNRINKIVTLDNLLTEHKDGNRLPVDLLLSTEKNQFVIELLGSLSDDCRKILTLAVFEKLPMKKISVLMNYQNEQIARNKKSKCMKYLKNAILKSTHLSQIFKELK